VDSVHISTASAVPSLYSGRDGKLLYLKYL
jgi:hypothetical protein